MLLSFWNSLSTTGAQYHYDDRLTKRIVLTNQFGIIGLVVIMTGGVFNFLLGDYQTAIVSELVTLLFIAVLVLNRNGHHRAATTLMLSCVSVTIFYFNSYSGPESGPYLYYFPLMLAIAFLFDFRERQQMLMHFFLNIILLAINLATGHSLFRNEELDPELITRLFSFNLLFSIASIGFFIYLTISNNIRENAVFDQRLNERKATEEAITSALAEKDILLAEIHHRVKNNLAIITSLFNLQLSSVNNEEARNILVDSKNRVKSMALIHDRLYKSERLSQIDFDRYTGELIDEIQYSYPTIGCRIEVKRLISDVSLDVNSAIPCGLILNELLSNCYKHAFKGRNDGKIEITFTRIDSEFLLRVKDDGVGLKDGYANGESLGMVVIQSLSEQLDGRYSFTVQNGTTFELKFSK